MNDAILFGSRTNSKPTKKTPKSKEVKISSNGLDRETEDLSLLLMQNCEEFVMADLDDFSALSLLDKDKENVIEDVDEHVDSTIKKKSKNTAKTDVKAQLSTNQKRYLTWLPCLF